MQLASIGAKFAPAALLIASFMDCSLISLPFLVAFLFVQYKSQWRDINYRSKVFFWGLLLVYSTLAISFEGMTALIWSIEGRSWSIVSNWFFKLLGLARLNPWLSLSHVLIVLGAQLVVIVTAACALNYEHDNGNLLDFSWGSSQFQAVLRSIVLPAVQLVAGIARPCWIAFPFFLFSCVWLLHWCITSNFVGLSWGWRRLLVFTGLDILLLYLYQLPFGYPEVILKIADYLGLFKVSEGQYGWPEIVQSAALVMFYILLCVSIYGLEERDKHRIYLKDILPMTYDGPMLALSSRCNEDHTLTERLLGSPKTSHERETQSLTSWTMTPPNCELLQLISINFFTYGFPICLVILSLWSFKYASISAFFILFYVAYVLYTFPSVPILWRLSIALLAFILFWALCTYIFNATFTVLHDELDKDPQLWNTIGFWHYQIPGFFLLAQFVLGVLIGTAIYFGNVALRHMHTSQESSNTFEQEKHDIKVIALAVIVWCIHKSAHTISLVLLFLVGLRHGLIGAIYILLFLIYLLRPQVATRTRQYLIFMCEIHFGTLYLLQLDLICAQIDSGNWILSLLGLSNKSSPNDFLMISALLIFSALQSRGLGLLLSIASWVEKSQLPPFGFEVLKSSSGGPALVSVCASHNFDYFHHESNLTVKWIVRKLADLGGSIRATYRSFGTLIAASTILIVVYILGPNYISFGYLILLLFWLTGRQLLGKTKTPLWFPLVMYTVVVFIFHYLMTCFPALQELIGRNIRLYPDLCFNPAASFVVHLWDSLLILIVMQLFIYERAQTSGEEKDDNEGDHIDAYFGYMALLKRFLILHSDKVLSATVFYASMSPVSFMGFVYLLMLVATSLMPKVSRLPAKLVSLYTALLIAAEFLYQIVGAKLQMLPEQVHGPFACWIGFRVLLSSFWGLELGLRSRVLVFASCLLRYSAYGWLEQLPASLRNNGKLDEPCFLFVPYPQRVREGTCSAAESDSLVHSLEPPFQSGLPEAQSELTFSSDAIKNNVFCYSNFKLGHGIEPCAKFNVRMNGGPNPGPSVSSPNVKQSRQWSKRVMLILRRERYKAQLRTLQIHAKHVTENLFNLFGVGISMLVLLFASFAVLNVISLLYIIILSLCILLNSRPLKSLWPYFVLLFASILVIEYMALGKGPPSWSVPRFLQGQKTSCHRCWEGFQADLDYCSKCWLGVVVDDWQTLVAYYMVFFIGCLKLKSDMSAGNIEAFKFYNSSFPPSNKLAWKEINYETKGQWTWLDRLRFVFYLHFLDIVLILLLITGTFQYDVLHLGYLAFALIFFRMRVKLLRKRNKIFCFLRLYNFLLILLSLLYQAPYFGGTSKEFTLYNIIGLVKIPFGFNIASQSVLVDMTIFCVVAVQSSIFCSKEFEQVLRCLEAEEMDAKLEAQEAKAAWKTEQLQYIRNMEECRKYRRLQVEKMKSEMLHLQLNVDVLNSSENLMVTKTPVIDLNNPVKKGQDFQYSSFHSLKASTDNENAITNQASVPCVDVLPKGDQISIDDASNCRRRNSYQYHECPGSDRSSSFSIGEKNQVKKQQKNDEQVYFSEILDEESAARFRKTVQRAQSLAHKNSMDNNPNRSYLSGVHIIENSVAHVQSFGNRALADLVGFLNIEQNDCDGTAGPSFERETEVGNKEIKDDASVTLYHADIEAERGKSSAQKEALNETSHRLSMLYYYLCSKIRSNIDVVCYFFFLLAYIWDFSLLMLVYPASLFLYALLVNPGPSQHFWLAMLIYTEVNILVQYMNQVLVHHSMHNTLSPWLKLWLERAGIPTTVKTESFVAIILPLFLVYLSTLVQSSIKARDGEWMSFLHRRTLSNNVRNNNSWKDLLQGYSVSIKGKLTNMARGLLSYCQALMYGSESPPHFVQVTMRVSQWPEDGIQPEMIESGFNRLLKACHHGFCEAGGQEFNHSISSVRIESIESSEQQADVVIAVLEVIYASPGKGCPASDHYTSLTPAKDVALEIQRAKDEGLVDATSFPFPILSVIAGGKREVDLYAYIFGADLTAFFLVAVWYQSFIKNSPDFLDVYKLEDQFPKEFVFVLMTLFFLIIVDRVIYLCSFATGKICFYLFNLGLFTYYATHYDWQMSTKEHGLLLLRIFCLIKGLSLSLQASQIKYGLPHKTALYKQFLTRKISHLNHIGFRLYRSLPFLFELRCILDWSCSTTSLTMYDWLKLEDIYASLFLVQCDAKLSREKHHLGEKRGIQSKFFSGICTFLVLICIIWTPMLMYSSGNPTNVANPILNVHAQIDINTQSGRFMLYQTSLCHVFYMEDLVSSGFSPDLYLQQYELRDVQLICCGADADSPWFVSPPALKRLTDLVEKDFTVTARWDFSRQRPKTKEVASISSETFRSILDQDFNGTFIAFKVPELYPRYFRVTSAGEVRMLEGTIEMVSGNLSLKGRSQSWWSFSRDDASLEEGCGNLDGPIAFAVSEEVPPQGLIGDTLSKFSITSLYITFVLAVGRFIRLQCADIRMRIPYENLPSCDRLTAICEDIYAARAAGELILEEGLFWTLVRIYRSPHALLEYTKFD